MALAADFRSDLLGITEVSNIVDTRVCPLVDRLKELPVVVYAISSDDRTPSFAGQFYRRDRRITLRFYTQDYTQIETLVTAVRDRYDGFSGNLNSTGTTISYAEVESVHESFDTTDDLTFVAIITISLITRD